MTKQEIKSAIERIVRYDDDIYDLCFVHINGILLYRRYNSYEQITQAILNYCANDYTVILIAQGLTYRSDIYVHVRRRCPDNAE